VGEEERAKLDGSMVGCMYEEQSKSYTNYLTSTVWCTKISHSWTECCVTGHVGCSSEEAERQVAGQWFNVS
jgi:hypothetical protein